MHELKLASGIFKKLLEEARRKSLSKVSKVILSVGKASGISSHFLEHSLKDHLFPSTIFENSQIEIKLTEPTLLCRACSKNIDVSNLMKDSTSSPEMVCPFCGSFEVDIVEGNEIEIIDVL